MASGMIELMKRAALDAIESSQPTDLRIGTVVSVSPLKVKVSNQLILPSSILIVPQHLTDYNIDMVNVLDGDTKTMLVQGALKINDKVAMLRQQGGQSYFILDRI